MVLEDFFADVIARIFLRRSQPEAQLSKLSGVAGGGLSSGAWGGGKRAEILPGSTSSLERWLGAPSSTNRISRLANFRDGTFRKAWKHAVFDVGMIR